MIKIVSIPACKNHEGIHKITVALNWECPIHHTPRGDVRSGLSYDGSRRMNVDVWENSCGCVDTYILMREEAQNNGLNKLAAKENAE